MDITYHLYKELERHERALANDGQPNRESEDLGESGDCSDKYCGAFGTVENSDDDGFGAIEKGNNKAALDFDGDGNCFVQGCDGWDRTENRGTAQSRDSWDEMESGGSNHSRDSWDMSENSGTAHSRDSWDRTENSGERDLKNAMDFEELLETECEKLLGAGELCVGDDALVREAVRIIGRLKRKASRADDDLDIDYANRLSAVAELLEKSICGEKN